MQTTPDRGPGTSALPSPRPGARHSQPTPFDLVLTKHWPFNCMSNPTPLGRLLKPLPPLTRPGCCSLCTCPATSARSHSSSSQRILPAAPCPAAWPEAALRCRSEANCTGDKVATGAHTQCVSPSALPPAQAPHLAPRQPCPEVRCSRSCLPSPGKWDLLGLHALQLQPEQAGQACSRRASCPAPPRQS